MIWNTTLIGEGFTIETPICNYALTNITLPLYSDFNNKDFRKNIKTHIELNDFVKVVYDAFAVNKNLGNFMIYKLHEILFNIGIESIYYLGVIKMNKQYEPLLNYKKRHFNNEIYYNKETKK